MLKSKQTKIFAKATPERAISSAVSGVWTVTCPCTYTVTTDADLEIHIEKKH